MTRKTILIDLDGVLNLYDGKYNENFIPPIKDGAKEFLESIFEIFEIKIFTTRNRLIAAKWLIENKLDKYVSDITNVKEPAYLYIDDRCICFNGNYNQLCDEIKFFRVWYKH